MIWVTLNDGTIDKFTDHAPLSESWGHTRYCCETEDGKLLVFRQGIRFERHYGEYDYDGVEVEYKRLVRVYEPGTWVDGIDIYGNGPSHFASP